MKLLVESQRLIVHVKVQMCNYCFIKINYEVPCLQVLSFGSVRNMVAGFRWLSYSGYRCFYIIVLCHFTLGMVALPGACRPRWFVHVPH